MTILVQVPLTEKEVNFLQRLFQNWEETTFVVPTEINMTEIYDLKSKLDYVYTAFNGNKRGGM